MTPSSSRRFSPTDRSFGTFWINRGTGADCCSYLCSGPPHLSVHRMSRHISRHAREIMDHAKLGLTETIPKWSHSHAIF